MKFSPSCDAWLGCDKPLACVTSVDFVLPSIVLPWPNKLRHKTQKKYLMLVAGLSILLFIVHVLQHIVLVF